MAFKWMAEHYRLCTFLHHYGSSFENFSYGTSPANSSSYTSSNTSATSNQSFGYDVVDTTSVEDNTNLNGGELLSPQTATTLYETVGIDNIIGVIGMGNRLLNEE